MMDQPDRRDILRGVAAVAVAATWPEPAGAVAAAADPAFLAVSRAAVGEPALNPITAQRLLVAMTQVDSGLPGRIAALSRLLQPLMQPEELLALSGTAGLHDTVLALVAAWYTGTVGADHDGAVVAYHDALMYRPIADAVPVPTYCGGGPLWWTAAPPDVAVMPKLSGDRS